MALYRRWADIANIVTKLLPRKSCLPELVIGKLAPIFSGGERDRELPLVGTFRTVATNDPWRLRPLVHKTTAL